MPQSRKPVILIKSDVKKILAECAHDGHSILPPNTFEGVNPEFVKAVTFVHKSSKTDPKWAITTKDGPVASMKGIYTLSALQLACGLLQLESGARHFYGRGRQATAYTNALQDWLKAQA